MEKQWQLLDPDPQIVRSLSDQIQCDPLLARLLANRGIRSRNQANRFLKPSLGHLTPPLKLAGMEDAVHRIARALESDEPILVFGDYDADGITATAVLVEFLRRCGARVVYHIPHRIVDGYGMGTDFILNRARPVGVSLIITADCGSSSGEAVTLARKIGIDTIVTDHHPVAHPPEDAVAVINPARQDCPAGLAHLAGVGVAFYLIIALRAQLRSSGFWKSRREPNLRRLCDLVALGTVADVAPLIRENRSLTVAGLEQINRGLRPGIAALKGLIPSPEQPVDAEAIAFKLAPRLNAAGRLVHARMACELLLTENRPRADRLARTLCRLNSRRQSMENDLFESIQAMLGLAPELLQQPVLVLAGSGWHEGILGIVAARLTRQFQRPSVVITTRDGIGKGSARSIEGVDLSAALNQCADLLDRFGGHPLAAGLSIRKAQIDEFRHRLASIVDRISPNNGSPPPLRIDARVPLDDITPQLMDQLERLGPFGQGNPHPLFMDTQVRVHGCRVVGERHRQMVLRSTSGKGAALPAIQFNVSSGASTCVDRFEKIAYRPQWNYWNGRKNLQLMLEDIDPAF